MVRSWRAADVAGNSAASSGSVLSKARSGSGSEASAREAEKLSKRGLVIYLTLTEQKTNQKQFADGPQCIGYPLRTTLFSGTFAGSVFRHTFHAELPAVARVLPIIMELQSEGIQRYGFHGLSCESIVHQLAIDLPTRLVIAHLGNGASVTGVKGGKSIDTSMGLTPTGGVLTGTRSGDLDPGVLVYPSREKTRCRPRRVGRSPFWSPGNFGRRQRYAAVA